MKHLSFFWGSILSIFVLIGWTYQASAAPIDELVAAAKKEGALDMHAPSAITPQGAQELGAAFTKKYGLNIKVNYFPSSSFSKDTAKIISRAATGVPPEFDLTIVTENLHADLSQRKLHLPFDYKALGVDPKAVQHDNGSVAVSHEIVLPAYNKNVLAAKDVPKSWEDLLSSKWKDGKLGVPDSTYYFALLAKGPWGEKKTTEFVKGLASQRPFLGRGSELITRLELGEILVTAMMFETLVHRAMQKGSPIVFADAIEPVLISPNHIGVLKGAAHPNAGHLFAVFLVTPEAQELWEKHYGAASAFTPGTRINKFLKGKEALFMGGQDPAVVERLTNDYSKILGFTR